MVIGNVDPMNKLLSRANLWRDLPAREFRKEIISEVYRQ